MQFLMGLNESFDGIQSQILLLDPLPSVNKVYSMVLRIEKQREVSDLFTENLENTALLADHLLPNQQAEAMEILVLI